MDPVTILMLLLPIVEGGLQFAGVGIPASYASLINNTIPAIAALVSKLTSQASVTDKELAALTAVQTTFTNLRTSGVAAFSLNDANLVNSFIGAIGDAITRFKVSRVTTDPTTMNPLPTNL